MLHCKLCCYYYYNGEFECVILLFLDWDVMYQTYHCLLPREKFPIVLSGEVQCPRRWLVHYTTSDNTLGEEFPQE